MILYTFAYIAIGTVMGIVDAFEGSSDPDREGTFMGQWTLWAMAWPVLLLLTAWGQFRIRFLKKGPKG